MSDRVLSKSNILSLLQCPRRLWLEVHRADLMEVGDAVEGRIETGRRVGEVARSLFPGGVLIESASMGERIWPLRCTPFMTESSTSCQ